MVATLTIRLKPSKGGAARLGFTKTGPDTGNIVLETWIAGRDGPGAADNRLDAEVYAIEANHDASHLRCKFDHRVLLFNIVVTIDVSLQDGTYPPSLYLTIHPDPMNAGTTTYLITATNAVDLKTFLRAAAFPLLHI